MSASKKSIKALKSHKADLEEQNHNNIIKALVRIKNGNTENIKIKQRGKVTVRELALESGVSRASLYGNHKLLLEELEKINSKRSVSVADKRKEREIKAESDRALIRKLTEAKEMLARENFRINEENKNLKEEINTLKSKAASGKNIISIIKD